MKLSLCRKWQRGELERPWPAKRIGRKDLLISLARNVPDILAFELCIRGCVLCISFPSNNLANANYSSMFH